MSPLGGIPILNEVVHSYPHWQMIVKRAKISGLKYLPSLISSIPETQISLIGYSLGCRIIHYGMLKYKPTISLNAVNNIILLAGAIRTIKWEAIAGKIRGNVYNFYNRNDLVLNDYFSQFGLYPYQSCGIHAIKTHSRKIKNAVLYQVQLLYKLLLPL